jgi:hypothetical protein
MMKIFSRLVIFNIIIGYVVASHFPFSLSKPIREIQTGEWLLFIWVGFSIVSGLLWWGYMFYHWGVNKFRNKTTKRIWFWIILLGTMLYLIGPFMYYIVVFEMGKGLKRKT